MKRIFMVFVSSVASLLYSATVISQEDALVDSIYTVFDEQMQKFPMEKIHVQTDKPYYLAGENVWFRIFLVDAASHFPDTVSRFVYAELINPYEELIERAKIHPVDGMFHGYFTLPEDLPEGGYEIRFYTRFMEKNGEEYYFTKKIFIGDPLSALYITKTTFKYKDDRKRLDASFEFYDADGNFRFLPKEIRIKDEKGAKLRKVEPDRDSTLRLTLPIRKVIYMEYDYAGKFHKAFLPVTPQDDEFDVAFFPEGGQHPLETRNKVAFKAINSNGLGISVKGTVVTEKGDTIDEIKSVHRGMGVFTYFAEKGIKYFALCKNEAGIEKRFELPTAHEDAVNLAISSFKDKLTVSVLHSPNKPLSDNYYLIVHTKGILLSAMKWDNDKEFQFFNKSSIPSGVIQFLLTDDALNPVSERLYFNINPVELATTEFNTDKQEYKRRELVTATINIFNSENQPLTGNFSVSVTDNRDVSPDTSSNILTTLLLTSELKGNIEDPAFYFNSSTNASFLLDNLMLTQGWRRYDISRTLKGDIQRPQGYLELGDVISGRALGGILMNSPSKDMPVAIISSDGSFTDQMVTDESGRFYFNIPDLPDSTRYMVQALSKKGSARVELLLDSTYYPEPHIRLPHLTFNDYAQFADYMEKADQSYLQEFGMRTIYLDEIEVTAKKTITKGKSAYSSAFNTIISLEEFTEHWHPTDIFAVLRTIAGVTVSGQQVSIRGGGTPLVLIDDTPQDAEALAFLAIDDVDEIEVVKDSQAAFFGSQGANGVIMITTKRGFDQTKVRPVSFNIKAARPLGYQIPKEFYSPKYDTPQALANKKADLRTTIYWNPGVQVEAGNGEFAFYTADVASYYTIIIQGISSDGKPFHAVKRILAGQQ